MSVCRLCEAQLSRTFVDLGVTPLSNAFLAPTDLARMEPFYPLHAFVCDQCLLVQLEAFETPENIFGDYAYFSSFSDSWLAAADAYAEAMVDRFALGADSSVIEVASNDGYLLQYFQRRGVPVLGVEPARNVAATAVSKGIPTITEFFGAATAQRVVAEHGRADLTAANNVLAHVPDLNDFIAGFSIVLAEQGVATFEFPHLLRLIESVQFDTIYHEHFSYFSLLCAREAFRRHGLRVFDVEALPSHGGSLRIYVTHDAAGHPQQPSVAALLDEERAAGLARPEGYAGFAERVNQVKYDLLEFLIKARRDGKSVVGYGAPAKGNTLLVYCGIDSGLLAYTVDRSPHKQGHFLPGSRIPVYAPDEIGRSRPDYVLILPWNLRDEIASSMDVIRSWGGRFVVPIPAVEVF